MFRPIKNLITYIQKNASGSAIFGGATTAVAVAGTELEPNIAETVTEIDLGIEVDVILEAEKFNKVEKATATCAATDEMDAMEANELNDTAVEEAEHMVEAASDTAAITAPVLDSGIDADDDIELQIKSSIMLKQPPKPSTKEVVATPPVESHVVLDDELEDFRDDPMQQEGAATEDICSVGSAEPIGGEDTAEEFNTEEEDVEEPFLDYTPELETFPGSEIIVLNDADLNSSIASDVPSEDPLAIDDNTQPSLRDTTNPLDSSTNDEASTSADMHWLDVKDIKTRAATPPLQADVTLPAAPQKRAPLASTALEKAHHAVHEEQAEELRSDGSDSGLGSESSTLHNTLTSVSHTSQLAGVTATPTATSMSMSSSTPTLKPTPPPVPTHAREKEASMVATTTITANAICTTTDLLPATTSSSIPDLPLHCAAMAAPVLTLAKPLRSNLKRRLEMDDDILDSPIGSVDCSSTTVCLVSQQKKPKRSINFDTVQLYYFPRQQGFGCVPSAGGCTLGMAAHHVASKTLTLAEHAAELRRAHRLQLQEINPRGSSSDESEESEEDYLSEGSGSDLDVDSNGFLQPVPPKQRRALLKAAGVRKIDASEKADCRDIRNSREVCGCTCRDFCDPETCACSQAGIKCQVDRAMFPCGCSREACGNTMGRIEFNPSRVRTHYIHTIMRLEMENRQHQHPPLCGTTTSMGYGISMSASTSGSQALSQSYYGMQTQSNYSSGYASPAYGSDPTANYYQQQTPPGLPAPPQQSAASYSGISALQPDLHHHHAQPQYQIDSLDSNLFSGAVTATPSYGEIMPSFGPVSSASAASASVYHNISYSSTVSSSLQAQISAYASYQQHRLQATSHFLASNHSDSGNNVSVVPPTTFSSCAVPSVPPFGTATTTVASSQYHSDCGVALETTAPSCSVIGGTGDSNFIDLNTPIASSSRLSQINDLLQHNRNTTAALVAVTQGTGCASNLSAAVHVPLSLHSVCATTASIDTPPIEDVRKNCLGFEALTPPLHPTPIVAVLENNLTAFQAEGALSTAVTITTTAAATSTVEPSKLPAIQPLSVPSGDALLTSVKCDPDTTSSITAVTTALPATNVLKSLTNN